MEYDAQSALIVVDVQNDFASPSGSLYVLGAEQIVPAINDEIIRAGEAGALVVYSQDWHPETTPHFAKDGGVWPVHCVAKSDGAAFHPDLQVRGPVVRKGTSGEDGYSAFSMRDPESGETKSTGLGELLAERGVRRVVIAGLATDYCVKESVLDARKLGLHVAVASKLIGAVDLAPGDGERALAAMRDAGAVIE